MYRDGKMTLTYGHINSPWLCTDKEHIVTCRTKVTDLTRWFLIVS